MKSVMIAEMLGDPGVDIDTLKSDLLKAIRAKTGQDRVAIAMDVHDACLIHFRSAVPNVRTMEVALLYISVCIVLGGEYLASAKEQVKAVFEDGVPQDIAELFEAAA
jgi:hypothetical protein